MIGDYLFCSFGVLRSRQLVLSVVCGAVASGALWCIVTKVSPMSRSSTVCFVLVSLSLCPGIVLFCVVVRCVGSVLLHVRIDFDDDFE